MITLKLNKVKSSLKNENGKTNIEMLIDSYYQYCNTNMFDDEKCPCCKRKRVLSYHKAYERNLVYKENDTIKVIVINITVLVCSYCKKQKNCQKYHALLPCFILPYHAYEGSFIISSIYDNIIEEIKLEEILTKNRITHKLFYDWLRKLKKYLLPSSVILKVNIDINLITERIYKLNETFLISFYEDYNHPFFLFKKTCVPLCITP